MLLGFQFQCWKFIGVILGGLYPLQTTAFRMVFHDVVCYRHASWKSNFMRSKLWALQRFRRFSTFVVEISPLFGLDTLHVEQHIQSAIWSWLGGFDDLFLREIRQCTEARPKFHKSPPALACS